MSYIRFKYIVLFGVVVFCFVFFFGGGMCKV
jgi:hypothetical protein